MILIYSRPLYTGFGILPLSVVLLPRRRSPKKHHRGSRFGPPKIKVLCPTIFERSGERDAVVNQASNAVANNASDAFVKGRFRRALHGILRHGNITAGNVRAT